MIRIILYILSLFVILFLIVGLALIFALAPNIPRLPDDLSLLAFSPVTEVYARNGQLLSTSGGREYVPLDRISRNFQNAMIAVEDKRFYRHHGIDHIATFRALLQNVIRLGDAPGGSTITQQLAKNLFFTFERSWKRKILEAMAAMAIENRFSKDDILEAYCNLVPFGQYSYGIERASMTYFGKHASELELHEAALLAGLPNSPSRLNPYNHMDRAKERQEIILRRMAELKMIPEASYDSLAEQTIKLASATPSDVHGSFDVDAALEFAGSKVGQDVVNYGGIRIVTGIDPYLQDLAQKALSDGLDDLEKRLKPREGENPGRLEGALVAIEVASGQIVALVGGRNYLESPYNRALYAQRQPGSAFKPALYLAALETDYYNAATIVEDKPVVLKIDKRRTWKPQNFDHKFMGSMTLKLALMESRNTVAAQIIDQISPEKVVETARQLGIKTKLNPHLSLSLGSEGITPVEMTNMYATLARLGEALEPHLVNRIEVRGGEMLFEHFGAAEQRFPPETVYQLVNMMTGVIDGGTGTIVRRKGFKGVAACKTGTSSDCRDSWFIGATPYPVSYTHLTLPTN